MTDETNWIDFDLKVSISLSPALGERMRKHLFDLLRGIEADDDEVMALEHELPALWARTLDRQENPFGEMVEVSGDDLWEDYRWFGQVHSEGGVRCRHCGIEIMHFPDEGLEGETATEQAQQAARRAIESINPEHFMWDGRTRIR